jgi:hypothetical protein
MANLLGFILTQISQCTRIMGLGPPQLILKNDLWGVLNTVFLRVGLGVGNLLDNALMPPAADRGVDVVANGDWMAMLVADFGSWGHLLVSFFFFFFF